MKIKIFAAVILIVSAQIAKAQSYGADTKFGTTHNRSHTLYALGIPNDTLPVPLDKQGYPHLAVKDTVFYVWSVSLLKWKLLSGTASTYTASNGITLTGTAFGLGGSLNGSTTITNASGHLFRLYLDEDDDETGLLGNNYGGLIGFKNGEMVTRVNNSGLKSNLSSMLFSENKPHGSYIEVYTDSILIQPRLGKIKVDSLATAPGTSEMRYNRLTGDWTISDTASALDTTSLSARINTKLNITDTANIRARLYAGANITITGTYPNLTIESTGGGATPAGSYGYLQLNRNGALAATDSLIYAAGELRINTTDNGSYALQVAGNGYFKGAGANIVLEPNAGTNAYIQMKDQAGGISYLSADLGLSYIVSSGSYSHNFYTHGILGLQIKNIAGTSTGGTIETSTSQIGSSYTGTAGADKGAFHLERTINAGATGPNHHGFVSKTTFRTGAAAFNDFYAVATIGSGSGSQDHWAGFQTLLTKDSANTLSRAYDFVALATLLNGGTITDRFGFYMYDANPAGGGTLTNQYGVYIPALSGGTNNHGIVSLTKSSFGHATADSMLKTTSFHATAGIRGSGLPTGKQAYVLMIDANGTFYKADSTGLWAGGGGSGSPGGSDTYVQFNDASSFGGDAGMTYNKTTNALKVAGSAGDITSWFNANSGASASTTSTNPGVLWFSGGAGSMYGAHIGYQGGFGTEFITGDATSFFWSRGGGNSASNFTVGMALNGGNELIINNGVTDGGDYKLQVNGNGLISGSITTAAPTDGTAAAWKLGSYVASAPAATGYVEVQVGSQKIKFLAATY